VFTQGGPRLFAIGVSESFMLLPTTMPGQWQSGPLTEAPLGHLVFRLRQGSVLPGIVFGVEGKGAHVIWSEHDRAVPQVFPINERSGEWLRLDPGDRLRLYMQPGPKDHEAEPGRPGCLGLISGEMVVCASAGSDGWGEPIRFLIRLGAWQAAEVDRDTFYRAQWLSDWRLTYRAIDDSEIRLIGSPDWENKR
jgi:hypothetical protein